MLPKNKRLNLRTSFSWVSQASRAETPSLKVRYRFGENQLPLIGISLSSRVLGKANIRNKVRRKISTAVQNLYPRLRKDLNLVIMPKEFVLSKSIIDLEEELKSVKNLFNND